MAVTKTYLIGLYLTAKSLQRYMKKWEDEVLENDLSDEQITAFADCLQCVNSLVQLFRPAPPNP